MRGPITCFLTVACAMGLAGSARAADPLLSGYSGPGGGDQAILGSQVLPGGGTSGGTDAQRSLRAPAATSTAAGGSVAAAGAAVTGPASGSSAVSGRPASAPEAPAGGEAAAGGDGSADTAPARSARRPVAAGDTSASSPLGTGDALVVALALVALILLAVGTARLGAGRLEPR